MFIQAPSGRQRLNVLGAINAVTHELITVTNDTYINAQSFCELLRRISQLKYNVPITVSSQNFIVKCKNLVFCTSKVELYNLIYPVLLRGYQ